MDGLARLTTLLHFGLSGSEEMIGIGGFGIDVLHDREHAQDVVSGEQRLMRGAFGIARRRG